MSAREHLERSHQDSHDTNVRVDSRINFTGPIIILGGSILLVVIAVGVFIFGAYVIGHWKAFNAQTPGLINFVLLVVGAILVAIAGKFLLNFIGLSAVDVLLKLIGGIVEIRHHCAETRALRARNNLLHVDENKVVVLRPSGQIDVIPVLAAPATHKVSVVAAEEQKALPAPKSEEEDERGQPPAPYDMEEVLQWFHPSRRGIFLGEGADGKSVIVALDKLWHIAFTGPTGGGKSNIMKLLLEQLLAVRSLCYLCDPHFAPIKRLPNGIQLDWRPIAARLATAPLRRTDDIAALLKDMARGELQARIDRAYNGEPVGDPLYIALEELPVLAGEQPDAMADIAKLLRQGRQYGMYVMSATQDMLVKTLGSSSGVRECYRTGFYTGGDVTTARVILDLPKGQQLSEDGLGDKGLVYLKTAVTTAQLVRVPFASNEACYALLGEPNSSDEFLTRETPSERRTGPLGESGESQVRADGKRGESLGESGQSRTSAVRLSPEERVAILAAARAQLAATGKEKVVISKLIESQPGWNNKWWPKIKQILDEEGL